MILTWIRRKLFVSKISRQPFVESNVLVWRNGRDESLKAACLNGHKKQIFLKTVSVSVKPDFMILACYFGCEMTLNII